MEKDFIYRIAWEIYANTIKKPEERDMFRQAIADYAVYGDEPLSPIGEDGRVTDYLKERVFPDIDQQRGVLKIDHLSALRDALDRLDDGNLDVSRDFYRAIARYTYFGELPAFEWLSEFVWLTIKQHIDVLKLNHNINK